MYASDWFMTTMVVLLAFAVACGFVNGNATSLYSFTSIIGFVTGMTIVAIACGISILGSGFNAESTKIIFGVGVLLNILFQISFNVVGFTVAIGLGILTNTLLSIPLNVFFGIPFIILLCLGTICLISGLLVITGGTH
jgi:hypothetical protein